MSAHFSVAELTFSQIATRRGIDNTPSEAVLRNLHALCDTLELVRTLAGRPITISSGYRCAALNTAVGGARDSAHLTGQAADIGCAGMTPKALATMIRDSDINFDQLIYEGTWVHIAVSGAPRRDVLTAKFNGGVASYTRGIA